MLTGLEISIFLTVLSRITLAIRGTARIFTQLVEQILSKWSLAS